ncbi:uncharacterized protein LAESUDRAFT_660053 [Laetiporus sulphureus 93-53]|uniref:protein-tyrosine-phosphatase n=1 Tax=Laetiporus sulphureus 93-53 TaxID=1314785 RepID=A0A165CRY3_9APHY|nr:uncharacterized protein LAESUDRAFT_660053 [Laetiporus sulphureus 93-53]KZT03331.1 hypothetical protein LAESUDRAFT_660053 [Laetiporus sulphureus 93-53]
MPPAKRGRPPNLTVQVDSIKRPGQSNTIIELVTPVDLVDDLEEIDLQSSSPSSSSSSSLTSYPSNAETDSDAALDDLSKDLAALEQLRQSVEKNLRLRPLRSAASVHGFASSSPFTRQSSSSPYSAWSEFSDQRTPSPTGSASPASAYFTPLSELRATPLSAYYVDTDRWRLASIDTSLKTLQPASGMDPAVLVARLSASNRPILIDTRPVASFLSSRLERSINMAIPSLILKRCRKPNGGFHDFDALHQYITTEDGKRIWDDMISSGEWDGDVILYDETMDEKDRHNPQSTVWVLVEVVQPLLDNGSVDYLEGGLAAARQHPYLQQLIITDDGMDISSQNDLSTNNRNKGGLFQLDVASAGHSRNLPEVEQMPSSPAVGMPLDSHPWSKFADYATPSPPPSQTIFSLPSTPRRPSIPTLRKIDTSSAERLNAGMPKLQVRTVPTKAATLAAPPMHGHDSSSIRSRSRSPSHLNLAFSNNSPPKSARLLSPQSNSSSELLPPPSPSFTQSSTPRTPVTPMPRSPSTARPDSSQPPTTEEDPYPVFTVSTILPNFLYLGPELTAEEHVEELLSLGVKRILNIAFECDDDHGLHLRERFERYVRIPMRDTVEEDNITRGVRDVCELLDDARLHSAPTYVHCKAGKSRSVTAVMAYLIHANHWTLSKAYSFVLERRKGISPNIGFVSELMTFEEQELGGKSVGVIKAVPGNGENDGEDSSASSSGLNTNYQVVLGGRRPQNVRESLPPVFTREHSFNIVPVPTADDTAAIGDSGQEMEIKDASGRYRHARRAPVDVATLQPLRRVSKAGLESTICS